MVCFSFEKIIWFRSLDYPGVLCVREKAFNLNFSTLFNPKGKNPRDIAPLNKIVHVNVIYICNCELWFVIRTLVICNFWIVIVIKSDWCFLRQFPKLTLWLVMGLNSCKVNGHWWKTKQTRWEGNFNLCPSLLNVKYAIHKPVVNLRCLLVELLTKPMWPNVEQKCHQFLSWQALRGFIFHGL